MSEPNFRMMLRSSDIINRVPDNSSLLREGGSGAGDKQGTELGAVHLVDAALDGDPNITDSSAGLYLKVGTALDGNSTNKVIRVGAAYVTSDATRPDARELNNEDRDYTGDFWFRADTKELFVNETGAHTKESWYSLIPRYNRTQPVPYAIGGVKAGDTFNELTLQEVFDKIFYPSGVGITALDITPSPLSSDGVSKILEVGASIAPPGGDNRRTLSVRSAAFTSVTSISYKVGNQLGFLSPAESQLSGAIYSGSGKDRILTYSQSANLTFTQPTKFYWQAFVTGSDFVEVEGPYVYAEWTYVALSFSSEASSLVDPFATYSAITGDSYGEDKGVNGPQLKYSRIEVAGKMVTGNAEYLYVCLPIGRVVDGNFTSDGFNTYSSHSVVFGSGVPLNEPVELDIVRNGVTVRYWVYRTTNPTSAAITIKFE